jgi:hypothetical protein
MADTWRNEQPRRVALAAWGAYQDSGNCGVEARSYFDKLSTNEKLCNEFTTDPVHPEPVEG